MESLLSMELDDVARKIGTHGPNIRSEVKLPKENKIKPLQDTSKLMEMTLDSYAAAQRIPKKAASKTVTKTMRTDISLADHIDATTSRGPAPRTNLSFQRQQSFFPNRVFNTYPPRMPQVPWMQNQMPYQQQPRQSFPQRQVQYTQYMPQPAIRQVPSRQEVQRRPLPSYNDLHVPSTTRGFVRSDADKRRSSPVPQVVSRKTRVAPVTRAPSPKRAKTSVSYPTVKVTGIPSEFNRGDILSAFEDHFVVHNVLMKQRGTAFVSFNNIKDARQAILQYDGGELNDRKIKVAFVDST